MQIVNLDSLQAFVSRGRLVVKPDTLTTMRDLRNCGLAMNVKEGIKLLGNVFNTDDVLV